MRREAENKIKDSKKRLYMELHGFPGHFNSLNPPSIPRELYEQLASFLEDHMRELAKIYEPTDN